VFRPIAVSAKDMYYYTLSYEIGRIMTHRGHDNLGVRTEVNLMNVTTRLKDPALLTESDTKRWTDD